MMAGLSRSRGFVWHLACLVVLCVAVVGARAAHTVVLHSDPPRAGTLFGAGRYEPGERVHVTALPARGFEFGGWFEDGAEVSLSPSLEFIADRDRILVARFLPTLDLVGITGSWQGALTLLPTVALGTNRVEVRPRFRYGSNPWDLRFVAAFAGEEWRDAQGHFTGAWDRLRFGGGVVFNPLGPAYRSAYAMVSGVWDDLRWGLRVAHYPSSGTPPAPYLLYTLTLSTPSLWASLNWEERDGVKFRDALVNVFGVEVCCGIQAQGTLSFTKEGFSYLRVALADLPFPCCGLSFDASITYTADRKEVEFAPRWNAYCDACLTVYGDVLQDWEAFRWEGFAIHGYKILCCLGGCCPGGSGRYIEVVTAFDPSRVPGGFQGDEFEYVKVGACGAGCCGGNWSVEATAYFSPSGGLFGLTRLRVAGEVPLWRGLSVTPAIEVVQGGTASFGLSWRFSF